MSHKFSIEKVTRAKDITFYKQIIEYCDSHNISYNASNGILNDLANKYKLKLFEDIADFYGYKRHNCKSCHKHPNKKDKHELTGLVTRAFIVDFGSWVWNWTKERNISIRRIWYLRYKQLIMILFVKNHDIKTDWKKYYPLLLSANLWEMIQENPDLYYDSFAIKDMSRQIWSNQNLGWKNIIILVEKDTTTPFYIKTCEILGIQILFSGHGKTAAAAVELIYKDIINDKFDHEYPIYVFTMTDWDEDGLLGVESGFVEQVSFYAQKFDYEVIHMRVGIYPDDIAVERRNPYDDCFELPNQHSTWALENGVRWENEEGEIIYLGIELEALPTEYFYDKILNCCLEFYSQAEMSDFIRQLHTPEAESYKSVLEYILTKYLGEHSYEYKELEFKKEVLQRAITDLDYQQNKLLAPYLEDVWETTHEIPEQENWDDRQREWDEINEEWDIESVEKMEKEHALAISAAIKAQKLFNIQDQGLGFRKNQLTSKFMRIVWEKLQQGDIKLTDINTNDFTKNKFDYSTIIIPNSFFPKDSELEEVLYNVSKIEIMKSVFKIIKKAIPKITPEILGEDAYNRLLAVASFTDLEAFQNVLTVLLAHDEYVSDENILDELVYAEAINKEDEEDGEIEDEEDDSKEIEDEDEDEDEDLSYLTDSEDFYEDDEDE